MTVLIILSIVLELEFEVLANSSKSGLEADMETIINFVSWKFMLPRTMSFIDVTLNDLVNNGLIDGINIKSKNNGSNISVNKGESGKCRKDRDSSQCSFRLIPFG